MSVKKRFYVTEKDIRLGIPRNVGSCPIARCMKRAFPDSTITVGKRTLGISYRVFQLSDRMKYFVHMFDRNIPVKRTSFQLDI